MSSSFSYWNPNGTICAVEVLERAGLPRATRVAVSNTDYNTAVFKWLTDNWTTNWAIINFAGELLDAFEKAGSRINIPVKNRAYTKIGNAFGRFCSMNRDPILHLYRTIGNGANPEHPPISKAFNNMTYAERKAIMMAKQASLVDVTTEVKTS